MGIEHKNSLEAIDIDIVVVEDSTSLQKKIANEYQQYFRTYYQAYDGQQGLNIFEKHRPSIVITNLNMPKMNGFEMILKMKKIDPKVQVIVLSSHANVDTLFELIHIGICDFVKKPLHTQLMEGALSKAIAHTLGKEHNLDEKFVVHQTPLTLLLQKIVNEHQDVMFYNYYKGLPLIHSGKLVSASTEQIEVKVSPIQKKAILYEQSTIIDIPGLDEDIQARLMSPDSNNQTLVLSNLYERKYSPKKREFVRVEPNKNFRVLANIAGKKYETEVNDLSVQSLSLNFKKATLMLKKGDIVDIGMGFRVHHSHSFEQARHNEKISCRAQVLRVVEKKEHTKVVVVFKLAKSDSNTLSKYIYEREMELIDEFKRLS